MSGRHRTARAASAAVVACCVCWTKAAVVTVPGTDESATTSGLNTPLRNAARVYQGYIDESQLGSITEPVFITGMRFRLAIGENWRPSGYLGIAWPNQNISFSQWDVQLGEAAPSVVAAGGFPVPGTFSGNQAGAVTVRSGSLTIPANNFVADGGELGVHSFGPLISFSTAYTYDPGETLIYTIRHSGYTQPVLQAFFASVPYANNVADGLFASTGAPGTNTPGGYIDPMIVQFEYQPVPEPATAALLALAGLVVIRRPR